MELFNFVTGCNLIAFTRHFIKGDLGGSLHSKKHYMHSSPMATLAL